MSGYTCYDLLIGKTVSITYLYRCESGGMSVEAPVMGVEQQPLVGAGVIRQMKCNKVM